MWYETKRCHTVTLPCTLLNSLCHAKRSVVGLLYADIMQQSYSNVFRCYNVLSKYTVFHLTLYECVHTLYILQVLFWYTQKPRDTISDESLHKALGLRVQIERLIYWVTLAQQVHVFPYRNTSVKLRYAGCTRHIHNIMQMIFYTKTIVVKCIENYI